MFKYLLIAFLAVSLSAMQLNARGAGITEAQEAQIKKWGNQANDMSPGYAYQAALYFKDFLDRGLGSFWVVEIMGADGFVYGRSGVTYTNDQWVSFYLDEPDLYFWVWVPASSGSNEVNAYLPSIMSGSEILNLKQNLQQHGTGISNSQATAIEKIMSNAELAKGSDVQGNADFVQQKLVDAFGSNWIVQIYGGDFMEWGRGGLQFSNDQWLFYTFQGQNSWQYLIWVPGY